MLPKRRDETRNKKITESILTLRQLEERHSPGKILTTKHVRNVYFSRMSANKFQIKIPGITVEVIKKNIRNINLRVCPPNGEVRLSSPKSVSPEYLRQFVHSKQEWIKKKVKKVRSRVRFSELEYRQGEIHFVQGKKYLLKIIEHTNSPKVVIRDEKYLDLSMRPGSDAEAREKVLREWYRSILKRRIPVLITKWEHELGVSVSDWGIKKMKTRWGTCNTGARRIWLNLELAKRPEYLLDYVVLHEMVHLKERLHNNRFKSFLDRHMPDWRDREYELKKSLP